MTTRDEVIEMTVRMLPPLHEPLRTQVAEEWADRWLDRFTITPKAGDATSPLPVVSDAAVEAAARALRIEEVGDSAPPGFAVRQWDIGETPREKPVRLARAALSAALPFLGAAPSATREEVGEALHPGLFSLSDYEYARRFDNHGAEDRAQHQEAVLTDEVDPLLERFTVALRADR